jgi:hypothetical protein
MRCPLRDGAQTAGVRRAGALMALVAAAVLLVGCSGSSHPTSATGSSSTPSPSPTTRSVYDVPCPNPEGRDCLGLVAAGTYTTQIFDPTLSYTVPAGWANMEDTPGNFLLLPPKQSLEGVNAGTSDYIGVYTSVFPVNGCDTPDGDVVTPAQYVRWMTKNPGLVVTGDQAVSVGGLSGRVVDLRVAKTWKETCEGSNIPTVTLESGSSPSSLIHGILKGMAWRMYLLSYHGSVLAVEVDDIHDAHLLDTYSNVVNTFDFHQS